MKLLRRVLRAVLLATGLTAVASSWAADNALPDLGTSKAAVAQAALKKDAVCTKCHDENEAAPVLSIYQTKHGVKGDARTPTCQSCHGESELHVKGDAASSTRPSPDVVFKKGALKASEDKDRMTQCLTCHKDSKRNNWDGSKHQTQGIACDSCHQVHRPADKALNKKTQPQVCANCHKEQRADSKKMSHHPIDEGKVACADCHNPHGSTGPKQLKKNTVNETCYQCHAEKRGPFLFEHQPVSEDCSNCHTPHGSNITPLLKSRSPFMCQECHDGTHTSGSPFGPATAGKQAGYSKAPSKLSTGRGCTSCHNQVHGTNSPAGGYLQR